MNETSQGAACAALTETELTETELTDEELNTAQGGLTILYYPYDRAPAGVTFTPPPGGNPFETQLTVQKKRG